MVCIPLVVFRARLTFALFRDLTYRDPTQSTPTFMPRRNTRASSPSSSAGSTSPTRSTRTPPNARITPSTQPPPVRRAARMRSRNTTVPSNNNTRTRLARQLFQTNEVLEPSNNGRSRKRTRPNTGWRKRVSTKKIPANVPEENRMALFTALPVTRGIPCVQCKKYLAKSNFRGLTRLGRPCPYCRHPIRKSNYKPNKPKSSPKRNQ